MSPGERQRYKRDMYKNLVGIALTLLAAAPLLHAEPSPKSEAPITVSLKQLRAGGATMKKKWVGKTIKVTGLSDGANSSTSRATSVTVTRVKMKLADKSFQLSCNSRSTGPSAHPSVGFGQPITFIGTLMPSGTDLEDCTYSLGTPTK